MKILLLLILLGGAGMGLLDAFKPQSKRYAPLPVVEHDDPGASSFRDSLVNSDYTTYHVAATGSMRPTLMDNDYVVSHKSPYDELKEGDIVNYRPKWNKGQLTIHRLVQKDKGGWIASGDNNKRSESWERVTPETYVNKVVAIHRKPAKKE